MLRERTFLHPITHRDRVRATETINGIECQVVLEQDVFGRYREISVHPVGSRLGDPAPAVALETSC
jgi:hypothetical protein